jgi:MFS family permease
MIRIETGRLDYARTFVAHPIKSRRPSTGRFVPAMAMITSSVEPEHRGGFMSVNSAVAQFSAALAATMAALVIHDGANHQLVGFGKVAWLYIGWAVIGLWLASGIRRAAVPTARPVV